MLENSTGSSSDLLELLTGLFSNDELGPLRMFPAQRQALRTGACYVGPQGATFPDYTDSINYTIIKWNDVQIAIKRINELAAGNDGKPIVLGLFSGGTLSMVMQDGVLRPARGGEQLLESAGCDLKQKAHLVIIDMPKVDSVNQSSGYVSEMVGAYTYVARNISDVAKRRFAGVLLGHGTDTAAETGALIRYMHTAYQIPVVMACAQYAADANFPDGPGNIAAGISALLRMHKDDVAELMVVSGGGSAAELIPFGHAVKDSDGNPKIFTQRGVDRRVVRCGELNGVRPFGDSVRQGDTFLPPPMIDEFIPVQHITVHQNTNPLALGRGILEAKEKPPVILVTSMGTATLPENVLNVLKFCQQYLDKARIAGQPAQQIVVLTAKPDANLEHAYESSEALRSSGIPICCMPLPAFLMKALVVCNLEMDPAKQVKLLVGDCGGDMPGQWSGERGNPLHRLLETFSRIPMRDITLEGESAEV